MSQSTVKQKIIIIIIKKKKKNRKKCFKLMSFLIRIQKNFNGSTTDGSFTTAGSNSFLGPLE